MAPQKNRAGRPKKTERRNAGRPAAMTELVLQKLREAFLMGCTDREACLYADIAPATLYNYQKDNPKYIEQKEGWKETPIFTARKTVVEALPEDKELAFKFLERKRRDEFGPKQGIDLSGEIEHKHTLSEDLKSLIDEVYDSETST